MWRKGLLFKLRQLGIAGTLYDWLEHYLTARSQKVVINGISLSLKYLQTGVPQGSILGPLLFLIYINDIINGLQCNVNLFADDTSIQKCLDNYEAFKVINEDLLKLSFYGSQWLISFNALKTEYIIVSKKKNTWKTSGLIFKWYQNHWSKSSQTLGINNKQYNVLVLPYKWNTC